jgi:hypothetical protein
MLGYCGSRKSAVAMSIIYAFVEVSGSWANKTSLQAPYRKPSGACRLALAVSNSRSSRSSRGELYRTDYQMANWVCDPNGALGSVASRLRGSEVKLTCCALDNSDQRVRMALWRRCAHEWCRPSKSAEPAWRKYQLCTKPQRIATGNAPRPLVCSFHPTFTPLICCLPAAVLFKMRRKSPLKPKLVKKRTEPVSLPPSPMSEEKKPVKRAYADVLKGTSQQQVHALPITLFSCFLPSHVAAGIGANKVSGNSRRSATMRSSPAPVSRLYGRQLEVGLSVDHYTGLKLRQYRLNPPSRMICSAHRLV